MNKVELAIIVLVLIGIIVSSGTMVYTSTVISDLSTVKSDVSTLTESVANLTSAIGDLATILGDLAANVTERLTAIEAALATKETLIVGTTDSVELTLDRSHDLS